MNKTSTKKLTYGALLIACSVILPQIFHLSGVPQSGSIFLPMHIPVLLGGFILGPVFGLVIGIISPIISSLITAMPPMARLPFMVVELASYGFFAGMFYKQLGLYRKKLGTYLSLAASMLLGRVMYTLAAIVATYLFNIEGAGGYMAGINAAVTGVCGIILQFMFIPPLVYSLRKGGMLDEFLIRSKKDIK